MFKEYTPLKNKIFQVIDNDGKVINTKWMPEIDSERLVKIYKDMLFAREWVQLLKTTTGWYPPLGSLAQCLPKE